MIQLNSKKPKARGMSNQKCCGSCRPSSGGGSAVYAFGMFGSLVYFFQHATTFTDYLWGIAKAFIWPALLVNKLFGFLNL